MATKKQSGTKKGGARSAAPASRSDRHHKLVGIGSIVVGVVLLAYLAYAVVFYFADPTDGFTKFWTSIFYYPAANVFVPGYIGWFLLSLLVPLIVAGGLFKLAYFGIKGKPLSKGRLALVAVALLIAAALQYVVPPVANSTVSYFQYISRVDALKQFQDKQSQLQQGAEQPSDAELKAGALQQLVLANVIEQEATKQGVRVSSKEVNDFYKNQAERSQGEANLKKQLKELLGWTPEQFKQEIRLRLLQEKLNTKLASDEGVNKERKEKAEQLLDRVKKGEDFATVAKDSDDAASASTEAITLKKGESDPTVEAEAFKLDAGQVSGIITTSQGYIILKVEEKVNENEVKVRVMTVRTQSLNEFLPEELKKTKVSVYVHNLVWDKSLYSVQPKDGGNAPDAAATNSPAPVTTEAAAPAAQ